MLANIAQALTALIKTNPSVTVKFISGNKTIINKLAAPIYFFLMKYTQLQRFLHIGKTASHKFLQKFSEKKYFEEDP